MAMRIEDYALIGDLHTTALVGRDGSIDWLCVPHFDSPACLAALVGRETHGRWCIAPSGRLRAVRRRYRPGTLVLETEFDAEEGSVRIVDFMPLPSSPQRAIVRLVQGMRGVVPVRIEATIRADYGIGRPAFRVDAEGAWFHSEGAVLRLASSIPLHRGHDDELTASCELGRDQSVYLALSWSDSGAEPRPFDPRDAETLLADTEAWWREWTAKYREDSPWKEAIVRSLCTLKALSFAPTGAIVAAPTTSLPERIGGVRNWDYRHCWLRDATFTLRALLECGFESEAMAWREWLLRVSSQGEALQTVYSIRGDPRIEEHPLEMLPGYEESTPVRIGNDACRQFQLDIYGEIVDAMHAARRHGMIPQENSWNLQKTLMDRLESKWREPDNGIWEVRGEARHFTHSKVMAWVACRRAVQAVECCGLDGPAAGWRSLAEEIQIEVCRRAFDPALDSFVQHYGARDPDASLLLIPLVGFLPATDPRMIGTVRAIEARLLHEGLLYRYVQNHDLDNLPEGEGCFLACSFWLADNYVLQGRHAEARTLFERLLALRNDVGLLAEQYDPVCHRQLGNFPQAFSHLALIGTAHHLGGNALRGHGGRANGAETTAENPGTIPKMCR